VNEVWPHRRRVDRKRRKLVRRGDRCYMRILAGGAIVPAEWSDERIREHREALERLRKPGWRLVTIPPVPLKTWRERILAPWGLA
jgi:hypothetical protein